MSIQLVGILNVTPDSFSDGGLFNTPESALKQAEQLFKDGAAIVDVGGESTRPNATALTPDEEWERIEPVLKVLLPKYPGKISVDSYHPETFLRLKATGYGDFIINDVSGCNNPDMIKVVTKTGMPIIVSHLPAKFGTDIQAAHASNEPLDTVEQVRDELLARYGELVAGGVSPDKIILDPGIGFGKTMELNAQLLEFAKFVPGKTVMLGYSRKRFLGEHRMETETNLAAGRRAIAAGTHYLRVHDVKTHSQGLHKRTTT